MYKLWTPEHSFPEYEDMSYVPGMKYKQIHSATESDYHFLLGAALVVHRGVVRVCWANSKNKENDEQTVLREKCLTEAGIVADQIIASCENGYGRSHGVYYQDGLELYVFCPKAKYKLLEEYPDLKMEAYYLAQDGRYVSMGVVLDAPFWPMCQPILLSNGNLIMAGLEAKYKQPAIAICNRRNLLKWNMQTIPNAYGYNCWGESTILPKEDRLLALVRGGKDNEHILVSESFDQGKTWTDLMESNFPISHSKLYAGRLTNGRSYVIFNMRGRGNRDTLAIAFGNEHFENVYLIRDGFDESPKFRKDNQWCYPYAFEHEKKLYVVYAKNKEDCEVAILPIENSTILDIG